jgi:hypothetical protein
VEVNGTVVPNRAEAGDRYAVVTAASRVTEDDRSVKQHSTVLDQQHTREICVSDSVVARPIAGHAADDIGLEISDVLSLGGLRVKRDPDEQSRNQTTASHSVHDRTFQPRTHTIYPGVSMQRK